MSLNGLDDPAVIESYQSALAEAGGWFLVKYVSRDTVALLARGSGGVTEIRITIDGYEETSPLYGFLQYRRRKIILKYVPEGISRLIQARITVQFQSILDKFSPHDTVFSLALSSELTESALSSACLLHTASSSMTSSSSSLRRRRLGEITEDAEECASPREETYGQFDNGYGNRRESVFSGTSDATAVPSHHQRGQGSVDTSGTDLSRPPQSDRSESTAEKPLPAVPRNRTESQSSGHAQRHFLDSLDRSPTDSRKSSQSTRPSLRDLDSISMYRPKVKLGPRPSMDPSGRPRTAGSIGRSSDTRPVASLPAGVRTSARKNSPSGGRPKSQPDIPVPRLPPSMAPPVPHLLIPPPPLNLGPMSRHSPGSPRSVMSVPSSLSITPEKQRLMRALELRKRQMEKRVEETEKKNDELSSGSKQVVKKLEVEGNKENIEIVQMEVAAKPQQTEVASFESDALAPLQLTPRSQEPQHPPSIYPVQEQKQTPPSPDPSNPDSAVDVGTVEPKNIESASSSTSVKSIVSSEVEEQHSSPTISVTSPDASKHREEDEACEASEPSQANPQIVETDTTIDTQQQTQNNDASESTQDTQPSDSPTDDLKVSIIEVPSGVSSPNATPRAIPRDCQAAPPQTAEMTPTDIPQEPLQSNNIPVASPISQKLIECLPVESIFAAGDSDVPKSGKSSSETEPSEANNLKSKHKGPVDPIHIVTQFDQSDEDNLLSDDSFMEELGSATFQEAKPIAVPKTPTAFAKNGDLDPAADWKKSRVFSNPPNARNTGHDVQALPIGRSPSGSFLESQKAVPVLVAKKVNVSSGISKRIKALEMFSSREGPTPTVPQPPPPTSAASSPFEKFRKRASMSQTSLPPASTLRSKSPSYSPSPSPSERRALSPNPSKRADSQTTNTQCRGKSNSVSVTARIIRDPAAPPNEPPANPSEPTVLNLQRSPIIVESDTPQLSPRPSTSAATRPEKRSLSTSSSTGSGRLSTSQGIPRSDSTPSKISASSRSRHEAHGPHPSPDVSHSPLNRVDESKEEKRESRKSRIIRRMSSITSNSRRGLINALSPTLKEEESQLASLNDESSTPEPPQMVDIGEVNVQFPDTLLWKRRFMRIDDQGYLILTPGTIDGTARNLVKRYHLSEFRPPFLPDQDRQELPNSIVLDFLDGSSLQCACESRQGQSGILQVLLEAHRAYEHVFPQQ
ncbi:GPI-anchored cell surface glycoprotein [Blastomyces dermatitidis ER-3]|uniref:GPI-anchored cell surface glycoprotein n=1 Tax=Ajellomyces dermatitidis (strain ER-3 / ATCC MYA-2586) TaxID=559297 RepID=A0ABP2F0B4_AJEDR|nr:GPI-anchored cell surface glycoprotein [Blastomyces dermatitidis ER-3]EEQ90046.1 GPI-anchored cell surface glycoprotein [Blastomyces dermatitidis ER-3]